MINPVLLIARGIYSFFHLFKRRPRRDREEVRNFLHNLAYPPSIDWSVSRSESPSRSISPSRSLSPSPSYSPEISPSPSPEDFELEEENG